MDAIPVFYDPAQVSAPASFSPSASKPRRVVERWCAKGFPVALISPTPLNTEDLCLAHDQAYVAGVMALRIRNGFGTKDATVARSLPWTTGSMLSAARHVLVSRTVAVSPTSGFHHAGYSQGGGFCTFNGLMITALALLRDGVVRRVGILDCDEHYGDGTEEIISVLGLRTVVRHVTAGPGYPRHPGRFLAALPDIVASFAACDLILYQAGADPHVDDPLGGWLTTQQLFQRDLLVFGAARALGIPLVWNLAGGYQDPFEEVLKIHDNTLVACIAEYMGVERVVLTPNSAHDDDPGATVKHSLRAAHALV